MHAFVTGGAGFIGSHLADRLIAESHQVTVIDNLSTGRLTNVNPAATFHQMDIRDDAFGELLLQEQPDVVFHLAAQISAPLSVEKPVYDAEINIIGTLNLLIHAVQAGVKKVIFSSSAAVYGDPVFIPITEDHPVCPLSGYGVSKLAVEYYLEMFRQQHGLNYTVLRFANVYGERQDAAGEGGVVSIFIDKLTAGKEAFIFGDGQQTRDFIYVHDVVSAVLAASETAGSQKANVSTNLETTVNTLYQNIKSRTGSGLNPVYAPPRKGDPLRSVLDNGAAQRLLGWKPRYGLAEGLALTVERWR